MIVTDLVLRKHLGDKKAKPLIQSRLKWKKEKSVAAKTQYDRCKSSILQEIVRARNILRGKLEQMERANIIRNGILAAEADNGDEALKCEIGALERFIHH